MQIRKRYNKVIIIMLAVCLVLANIEPMSVHASEMSIEKFQKTNPEGMILNVSDGNSYLKEDEIADEKVIVSFEELLPQVATKKVYSKPPYEELIKCFPTMLSICTRDGKLLEVETEWNVVGNYESEWEEITFEASIDDSYVLAENIVLPIIKVIIVSVDDNNEIMNISDGALEGSGTSDDPFLIYTVNDFAFVRQHKEVGIYYKLMADIDLSATSWIPLGSNNSGGEFCSNFDGNGYKLYNFTGSSSYNSQYGIFGYVKNSTIKNLGIVVKEGTQISSSHGGGIMMKTGRLCTIENCYVFGDYITTSNDAGSAGIIAQNMSGTISNCFVQGQVLVYGSSSLGSATQAKAGGIVGYGGVKITNCVCYADVSCRSSNSSSYSGGITVGSAEGNTTIKNCLFIGETKLGTGKVIGQIYGYTPGSSGSNVLNSYYLIENSANPDKEKWGCGKSVEALRDIATYEGWDFENVWTMSDSKNAGFPMLQSMVDVERPISKYLLPTPVDYSQRSGQVILSNEFEFGVYFDRDIEVVQNDGIYLKDCSSDATIACSYTVVNNNELCIKTEESMLNGIKYTLVINDNCIADVAYPSNYYVGQTDTYFVTVCKPRFEGEGSVENPYIVSDVERLNCVYYQPTMNYVLSNDIDASSVNRVNSIGGCKDTSGASGVWFSHYDTQTQGEKSDFTGVFDGNGYTISGIKKFSGQCVGGYAYDNYIGLFSSVSGGTIKNLNVVMAEDCYLYNEREGSIIDIYAYPYLSILVAKGNGTISNCTVSGTVYSNQETTYAGMIAGYFSGVIENCAAYGTISNEYNSTGAVAGGMVGHLTSEGSIRNSYAIVSVNGSSNVSIGGLVGNNKGIIANTYAAGTVAKVTQAGGLIGVNSGNIQNSFYDCTISGLLDKDRGTPKTSSSMKSIGTFYTWDFLNCWAINSKHNGGYPFLKGSKGADVIAGTPTVITVFDGTDGTKVIQNPIISILGADGEIIVQYQGDEKGVISMEDIVVGGMYNIEISAEGYGKYLNEEYWLNAFSTHVIMLYPQTDTPMVYCANLIPDDKSQKTIDILQKSQVLHQQDNKSFTLCVSATYANGIDNVCLIQGGKIKKRCKTGMFTELDAQSFECSEPIYIQIVGMDGVVSDLYRTYLSISDKSVKDQGLGGSLGFGKLEIDIPSEIPIIGGGTLLLDDILKEYEVFQVSISDGKIKCSVNLEATKKKSNDGRPEYGELKKLLEYDKGEGVKKYYSKLQRFVDDYGDLIKSADFTQFDTSTTSLKFKEKVFGYLEIDLITGEICGGKLAVYIGGSVGFDVGFNLVGFPMVLVCDFSAGAEGGATAKVYTEDTVWDISVNIKLKLSAGVGPGIPHLASLTFNGAGELNTLINYNTYIKNSSIVVDFTTDVFWKLKILAFEIENSLVERKYNLFDSNTLQSNAYKLRNRRMASNINVDDFETCDIVRESTWNGDSVRNNAKSFNNGIELLNSVYANSSPQIVKMGNDMMIVYLHQNASRTAINSTEVVYSIYDSVTQVWSAPRAVHDDGTADFYPQVIENSGEIYVIWENISEVVVDETGLNEFASLGKVSIAKYDYLTESFICCNSSISGMISNPCLDSTASKALWVLNESDDFLNDTSYSIQVADYDGQSLSNISTIQTGIEHLVMAKIGMRGTEIVVAYIYDGDGDFLSIDDHVLKIIDLHGNKLYESEKATISDVEFISKDNQKLVAYSKEGRVVILNDVNSEFIIEGNIPVTSEFSFVDGDMDYILFEVPNSGENSEIDLYAYTYNQASDSWNNAVPLINAKSQVTAYDAVSCGEGLQLIYQETFVGNGVETASLHAKRLEPTTDLGISNLVYDEEHNKLSVSMDITNIGLKSASGYSVTIYDGATVIYTENMNEVIGTAENVRYELELETTSVLGYEKNLDIVVTPINGMDAEDSNNRVSITVGYPDVSVALADEGMSEDTYIAYLELHNSGNCATRGTINVYVYDTLIDTIEVEQILNGEYRDVQIIIDTDQFDLDDYVGMVKFEFVSELDELYLHNNVITSHIYLEMNSVLGSIEAQDVSVVVGETVELALEFNSLTGNSNRLVILPMSYTVSDSNIAIIGEDGNVTGVKVGETMLTIIATDQYGNSATDTCVINVSLSGAGDDQNEDNGEDGADNKDTEGNESDQEETNISDSGTEKSIGGAQDKGAEENDAKNDEEVGNDSENERKEDEDSGATENIKDTENGEDSIGEESKPVGSYEHYSAHQYTIWLVASSCIVFIAGVTMFLFWYRKKRK